MKNEIVNKNRKGLKALITILGIGALDGSVALAALSGFFKPTNIIIIALVFLAGPAAILSACLLDGNTKERIMVALVAGIIATILVSLAAGFGPKFLSLFNLRIIKIVGAISVGSIALLIAGVKIPENSPFFIMIIGLARGLIWR